MDELLVRVTGIEPARRKALDPKSSASASSATLAYKILYHNKNIYGNCPCKQKAVLLSKNGLKFVVIHPRLELGTPWLKVRCSTNWASGSLAGAAGLEPTHAGVKVPCLTDLATPQSDKWLTSEWLASFRWGDWWESNPRVTEPQSAVLTTSPQPPNCFQTQ